jgi:hypothetical protein
MTLRHHIFRSRRFEIPVSNSRVEMIYSMYYTDVKGIYDKGGEQVEIRKRKGKDWRK